MAFRVNSLRIAGWTAVLAGSAALAFVAHDRLVAPSLPNQPPQCDPLPPNIVQVGPPTIVQNPSDLASLNESGWAELRAKLRQGDVIRSFETGVTGGHLATRNGCFVGQTLAWIR